MTGMRWRTANRCCLLLPANGLLLLLQGESSQGFTINVDQAALASAMAVPKLEPQVPRPGGSNDHPPQEPVPEMQFYFPGVESGVESAGPVFNIQVFSYFY